MLNRAVVEKVLPLLLRPIVRLCVRYGVKVGDVERALKPLFVDEAVSHLQKAGDSANASRLSVMTGLQRPVITSLLAEQTDREPRSGVSLVSKVIGAWLSKEEYRTSGGKPRVLAVEGKKSEFAILVSSISQALNPYTVLAELERAKLIERTPRGVRLLASSFVVREDTEAGLKFLAADWEDLVGSVEENLLHASPINHHLTTEYDRIPRIAAEKVRMLLLEEGHRVHAKIRSLVASFDKDISGGNARGEMVRVSFCSFGRVHAEKRVQHVD